MSMPPIKCACGRLSKCADIHCGQKIGYDVPLDPCYDPGLYGWLKRPPGWDNIAGWKQAKALYLISVSGQGPAFSKTKGIVKCDPNGQGKGKGEGKDEEKGKAAGKFFARKGKRPLSRSREP